jgi:hypothetical protein
VTIKGIRITQTGSQAILSAECKIRKLGWDNIYFSIDLAKKDYIHRDASPFAAALLIPAMMQGEDLIIKGSISKKLYNGMLEIMKELPVTWDKKLKPIKIIADEIIDDKTTASKVASFFTGGVDSFYTYLMHKNDSKPSDKIDSFILVNGFDVHPEDSRVWSLVLTNIKTVAESENIELVVVTTNLHQLLEPICSWGEYNNGSCLAAVGLFMRNRFSKIYIPSSYTIDQQKKYANMQEAIGTTVKVDELWSAENIKFVHDGADVCRRDKVKSEIAKSELALKYLRVCYVNKDNRYNCGSCDKCARTMVNLYLAGALEKAKTFPHRLDNNKIEKIYTSPLYCECFYQENISELQRRNLNPALQKALQQSFAQSVSRHNGIKNTINQKIIHASFHKLVYFDHIYLGGYLYSASSNLLGKKYRDYAYSVTECRPLTIRTTRNSLASL